MSSIRGVRTAGFLAGARAQSSLERRALRRAEAVLSQRERAVVARRPPVMPMMRSPSLFRTGGFSLSGVGGRELNFNDTVLAGLAINTTGSTNVLNGIVPGNGANQRIGRKITIKSISGDFRVISGSTTLVSDFRVAIVLDTQSNAAGPAITDIWTAALPTAPRNTSNGARFRILAIFEDVNIGNLLTAGQQTDKSAMVYKFYKRVNIVTTYNAGVAGTVGDIQTNGLFLVTVGSQAAGTTNSSLDGTFRIRYTD